MRLPPAVPVRLAPALLLGLALTAGDAAAQARPLERGMVITSSTRIRPGTYRLRVGLWYPNTGRRAGRFSAGTRLLGDYLDLGELTVRP